MCAYAIMCVLHSNGLCLRISMLRYIPQWNLGLVYKLRFIYLILASYCDITYFEILHLMYPKSNCTSATEGRSQCDDVMVHVLLE